MSKRTQSPVLEVPPTTNWRTTDEDEINRRRLRARDESFHITNRNRRHPVFSNFSVRSESGMTYSVEIRDLRERQFHCDCVDFRINGLGTCKHVEAVLLRLEARFKRHFQSAGRSGSTRIELVLDPGADTLRLDNGHGPLPRQLKSWFNPRGFLHKGSPEAAVDALQPLAASSPAPLRISQEIPPWLESRRRTHERRQLRHEYELKVQTGEWPLQETNVPLFPYQREGMLHLAFTERALLADEMGLGKTIQAIAACALLHRLGRAQRVLVVTPASLKTEWEEQIQRFTSLPYQLVFGPPFRRLAAYSNAPFFTLVNYEQMLADSLDVNARLRPDVVVLDEAQRIKNWSAKTSQAVKRLHSRYAFVLTGTPIENRIDDLHSLMDFLDPAVLGPLFRFNREYYDLDDRGRPSGYRNLDRLHERLRPYLLRRRKADVETELPERTDRNFFVPLTSEQKTEYDNHEGVVARLASIARRRPLTRQESEKLLRHLNMMRMVCDTNYILNADDRACPKLKELEKILEECRENPEVKVIVFSEWERMLELVKALCKNLNLGFAWHTGSVPQRRRRAEINAFKDDPACRVFLSTDSGATGLNLQNASVVVNCDLPWNPAKLEQRIARAWRKNQTRPVTVINLVSENTIEHRMLETLSNKRALADGVLDRLGNLSSIQFQSGRQAFLNKLRQLIAPADANTSAPDRQPPLPADRALGFAQEAGRRINGALLRCEERYPDQAPHSVLYVVVDREASRWRERLNALHQDYFGPGRSDPLAPVRLEVIDRATDEALQRLIDAGLVAKTSRATRPLFPVNESDPVTPALTAEQREEIATLKQQAARKLKMARVLDDAGLAEESHSALLEAILPLGTALAGERFLPKPKSHEDALLPPWTIAWGNAVPALRELLSSQAAPRQPALDSLTRLATAD